LKNALLIYLQLPLLYSHHSLTASLHTNFPI